MPASNADLLVYQGDDYSATVTVRNADGSPADITGYTAKAQIRRAIADEEPEVAVEIVTAVSSPQILLSIHHTQTSSLSGGYIWDLQLTTPANAVTTIMRGRVKLTSEVTRAVA